MLITRHFPVLGTVDPASQSEGAAVIKHHGRGSSNSRDTLSHSSGACEPKIGVSAGLLPLRL